MDEQNNFQVNEDGVKGRISTGAAIVFSIAGVLIAAIIVGGMVAWKSINVVDDLTSEFEEGSIQIEVNDPVLNEVESQEEDSAFLENLYEGLGFSLVLPEGVTAGNIQQSEGGPYQYIQFSDGTHIQMTSNLTFDDQYGIFPDGAPLSVIGENTFFTEHSMGGRVLYGLQIGGVRYEIRQDSRREIDLSTFTVN